MRGTPTTRLVDIKRENGESKDKGEVVNDMTRKRRSGQKKVWPCGICENTLPTKELFYRIRRQFIQKLMMTYILTNSMLFKNSLHVTHVLRNSN